MDGTVANDCTDGSAYAVDLLKSPVGIFSCHQLHLYRRNQFVHLWYLLK